MIRHCDIIIVGAGIAGCSAAAELSENASVVVLEMEAHPGYHSTGRSAATWAPYYGPPVIRALTALAEQTLKNPDTTMGSNDFTSPRGQMVIAQGEHEAELQNLADQGMQTIDIAAALKIVPLLQRSNISAVMYTDKLVNIDVNALHQAYIAKVKAHGGELHCNTAVQSMRYEKGAWTLKTTGNSYSAPVVVNAAGAWGDALAKLANADNVGLTPKRRSAALIPYIDGADMPSWPLVFDITEDFYCIPFGTGLMVSPADQTPVAAQDIQPEEIDIATGIDRFQHYFNYDVSRVSHTWAGLRTFAPDGSPVVGYDPQIEGFYWLTGQGGYGIQTSPAMAALASLQITNASSMHTTAEQNSLREIGDQITPHRFQ